jgi:hypothetical protein
MLRTLIPGKFIFLFVPALFALHLFAQPTITAFKPASAPIGTTITITGTNFSGTASSNIVFFGAVQASVSAATSTSLTVTVPKGATYQPISVTTNYLTAYSTQPFILTFPAGGAFSDSSFTLSPSLSTSRPSPILISDLDGDGKADLATLNTYYDSITIFRNTGFPGTISFAQNLQFLLAGENSNMTIGDVNGDGKPDLIVTNYYLNTITVYKNTSVPGSISFDGGTQFPTGNSPNNVSIADIDGDGKPDLVVINFTAGSVSILRNTGISGTISFAAKTDFTIPSYPVSMAITDFDADGKPDIAVASSILNKISIFKNTSSPGVISYTSAALYTLFGQLRKIVATDFDGDGKPDLALINDSTSAVFIYKNTGLSGIISFTSEISVNTSSQPIDIGVSDFDGDGKPDISAAIPNQSSITILPNTGSPGNISFGAAVNYNANKSIYLIANGDFDEDGRTDVSGSAFFDNSIAIFRNTEINHGSPPQITLIIPDSAREGTTVSIEGRNFMSATGVSFGGVAATSFTVVSDSTISAIIGTGNSGNVIVTTPNGTDYLGGFIFLTSPVLPIIQSFAPDSGNAGTTVTILGQHFTGTTSVSFGGIAANSFTVFSDSSISAIVGEGSTGVVKVTTLNGMDSLAGFTFTIKSPSINSFIPTSGSVGTLVTITGTNLSGTSSVSFGGTESASFTVISDSMVTAIVGMGSTGIVTVTTANGIGSLDGFIFNQFPKINSFTPMSGPEGTTVTISGVNFAGSTSISFGGIPASSYTVVSDSSIMAVVGAGASGSVRVATPNGADSLGGFTFTQGLTAHPNPANGSVIVNFPSSATPSQLKISDLTGRIIITINISPNVSQVTLNLVGIPPGVYVLIWSNGSNSSKQTLLID